MARQGALGAHEAIRARFEAVAGQGPEGLFSYPTGDAGLTGLGYGEAARLLPAWTRQRFCGVGDVQTPACLGPGQRVVDLGCGSGVDALLAAQRVGQRGLVAAVDRTAGLLGRARAKALGAGFANVAWLLADAEALPLPDNWADAALANGVLCLTVNRERAVAELFRVLRPGGRLIVADQVRRAPNPAQHPTGAGWAH